MKRGGLQGKEHRDGVRHGTHNYCLVLSSGSLTGSVGFKSETITQFC